MPCCKKMMKYHGKGDMPGCKKMMEYHGKGDMPGCGKMMSHHGMYGCKDKMHRCQMHGCCECLKYMGKQIPWQRQKAMKYKQQVCGQCKMMQPCDMHSWQKPTKMKQEHPWQRACEKPCMGMMKEPQGNMPCKHYMEMTPGKENMIWMSKEPAREMKRDKMIWHQGEPGEKIQKRIIIEKDDGSKNMMECIGDLTEMLGSTEDAEIEVEEMGGMKIITITSEDDDGEGDTVIIKMEVMED
jgi:hypothetical protein